MNVEMIETTAEQAATLPAAPEARAELALQATKTAADLRALVEKHLPLKGIEVKDKATREQIHGAAMELRTARTTVAKVSKDAREDATRFSKAVIAVEKELTAITAPLEDALLAQRDAWDAAEERRKEAEAAAKRFRILQITEKITALRGALTSASQCRTSNGMQQQFDRLSATEITEAEYQEFTAEALQVKAETLLRIKPLIDAKQAEEAEREAEQRRLEAERLAAAESRRKADAEAAALAAQRAELERQQREFAEQQAAFQRQQAEIAAAAQAVAQAAADAETATDAAMATMAATPSGWPDADGVLEDVAPAPEIAADATFADVGDASPAMNPPATEQPQTFEIVHALAHHFGVSKETAIQWLLELDMSELSAALQETAAA